MPEQTEDEQTTDSHDATGASSDDPGTSSRGPAFPTVMVNAAEQDPNPAEATSDSTAPQKSSDYDNDREDLPPGPTSDG
ncbi:hypothetical protein [uncultured Pseudokineococcus sp.]|uniref:hypothetical protein n=1 Tax=uncultured Pseudokineococcus sp. TaxID=1642928 RepID=UPI002626C81B|nr:hypothetical protein [uncultured Pseudokineococcus sp.]